jgi:hypothetical protein
LVLQQQQQLEKVFGTATETTVRDGAWYYNSIQQLGTLLGPATATTVRGGA